MTLADMTLAPQSSMQHGPIGCITRNYAVEHCCESGVAPVILEIGLHCEWHAKLPREECLHGRLAQIDAHARTPALSQVPA